MASTFSVRLDTAVNAGGIRSLIVTSKVVDVVKLSSSVTLIVIVDVPVSPPIGVREIKRFSSVPPKAILELGIKLELEEVAETIKSEALDSASPTVKLRGPIIVVLGQVLISVILETVGLAFAGPKLALIFFDVSKVMVSGLVNPVASPDHPVKLSLPSGVAVNVINEFNV